MNFLVFVHRIPDNLRCLFVSNQHIIVSLFHLKIYLQHLVLIIFTQLLFINRDAILSVLHNACHLLLVILEFIFLVKGFLLGLAQGMILAIIRRSVKLVLRNSIELIVGLIDSLGLLIYVGEDSLDDSIVCWFSAPVKDQTKARRPLFLDLLKSSNLFL